MRLLLIAIVLTQGVTACFGGFFSDFVHRRISKAVKLIDGGFVFKLWRDADVPIYMLVHFFNVTNPDRVLRGDKPILEEMGPYVYMEKRENEIEKFSADNMTVNYRMKTTYTFRPDYSYGNEDDIITTLNVPYVVMQQKTSNLSYIGKSVVREVFSDNSERLFIRKSVRELMFDGYYQPSVAQLSDFVGEELLPDNKFGYFYGKNGTLTDLLEIYTGVGNESLFGQTRSWEGKTELDYWDSAKCNEITGSDGSVFTPWLTRNMTIKIFSPELCRTIYLTYEKDVRVTGLRGYRYVVPRELLASKEENKENECFCKGGQYGPCLKTGAMRLAPCRGGTPVVISWPHFYQADPEYVNQVVGLKPEKEEHETFVILEPYTGYIRRGTKRFQINFEVTKNRQFRDMKRIRDLIFPVLWIEESKLSRFRTSSYFTKKKVVVGGGPYPPVGGIPVMETDEDEED